MNKFLTSSVAALVSIGMVAGSTAAEAQDHHRHNQNGRHWDRGRDHDRDGHWDRGRRDWGNRDWGHRQGWNGHHNWHYYGGRYGYNGYAGNWRSGQRYPYWRDRTYYVDNYAYYGLPAPRPGYRYYRDNNGDILMAAIGSGIIGLIIGGALSGR